jgi:hypothetical protein
MAEKYCENRECIYFFYYIILTDASYCFNNSILLCERVAVIIEVQGYNVEEIREAFKIFLCHNFKAQIWCHKKVQEASKNMMSLTNICNNHGEFVEAEQK